MTAISMTLSSPDVELKDGKGSLTASVSNLGAAPQRVVLGAFPAQATVPPSPTYASIEDPLRTLAAGATEQYLVSFDTAGAAAGSYFVKLIAYSADDAPEDYADQAHVLTLVVPADTVPPAPRRGFPWLWVIIGGVVLLAAVGTVLWFLLRGGVPDVKGKQQDQAIAILLDAGYAVSSAKVESPEPPGTVLSQSPAAGSRADPGSIISLEVSAPDTVLVPNVVGLRQEEASQVLQNLGLAVDIEIVSSFERPGTVILQTPPQGSRVAPGTRVTLQIAVILGVVVK
ncbi:PASTA domain-containing protein [Arthrobacter sp. CJ23]|uniref:PASTA domain-containing protein n=1 Tax=Arthrobacter sp. CJ23 TaxID=2972479 RepID=UPI00215C1799|nr:PASTA domain-containing protein [Arthrobacter sp. CJ23]UVJ39194.1 PASTA domain-containing protein [Arthrobacter sp. CJ23]